MPANLRALPHPAEEPAPDLSYEHRDRAHILSRDWSRVHVQADRAEPLAFGDRVKRTWWR
jgi:hypothetical protein